MAFLFALASAVPVGRAGELADQQLMKLWPDKAPGAMADSLSDIPTLEAFVPAAGKASGAAFVVCPGGGYQNLASHESKPIGRWFADQGITGFVLRYRVAPNRHPAPFKDGERAMRLVRAHAAEWKLDPNRIGILGFSAGGHLAATVSTLFTAGEANAADPIERVSSRPNLQVLIYPVIIMAGPKAMEGLRTRLLGPDAPQELAERMSCDRQVTAQTPPAFLVHSTKDETVPVYHSDEYAAKLKAAGVSCEFIRGEYGAHGVGLKEFWSVPCAQWLGKNGFLAGAGTQTAR